MDGTAVVLIILVLLVLVVLGVVISRRRRSSQLQQHFGPEYERSVAASGDRRAAEAELAERRQRREEFDVRDLAPGRARPVPRVVERDPARVRRRPAAVVEVRGPAGRRGHAGPRLPGRRRLRQACRRPVGRPPAGRAALPRGPRGPRRRRRGRHGAAADGGHLVPVADRRAAGRRRRPLRGPPTASRRPAPTTRDTRRRHLARPTSTDARIDTAQPGRHALRDEPGATGTADPTGTRSPRSEEHTR